MISFYRFKIVEGNYPIRITNKEEPCIIEFRTKSEQIVVRRWRKPKGTRTTDKDQFLNKICFMVSFSHHIWSAFCDRSKIAAYSCNITLPSNLHYKKEYLCSSICVDKKWTKRKHSYFYSKHSMLVHVARIKNHLKHL